jgi:DNA-binding transcriptional ArsR family regulator
VAQTQSKQNEVFRALADPTRRALLDRLSERDANVSSLVADFDMTQSAVSQHLKVLRDAGLVRERKSGRERIYALDAEPLAIAYDWFAHYTKFWEDRLLRLGAHLRNRHATKNKI